MPPKKQNGFMAFVSEWRQRGEGRNMSVAQAVSRCGDLWKNMSEQQRGPYKSFAKDANVSARNKVERLNCHGQPLSAVEQEEREAEEQQKSMKRSIERIVLKGKSQHDLENTKFLFASFNYFDKSPTSEIYLPAEFAACQFTLKSGRTSVYSSHINPGQLLFGQGSATQDHAATTHQLPLPPNALGEPDLGRLYKSILEYFRGCQNGDGGVNEPVVVFTATQLLPVVKGCFKFLESHSDEDRDQIQVLDIHYLFYVLKQEVMDIADLPHKHINKSITDNQFNNDYFEYHAGISCQFHEDNDRCRYCTQSMVSRWCYIFCDYMCGDLAITPLPGTHMPPAQEVRFRVTNPEPPSADTSVASFHSLQPEVKPEPKPKSKYVPTDHSAFSANLNAVDDFPSLGSCRPPSKRPSNQSTVPKSYVSRDPRSVWNLPASKTSMDEVEDAFNMPRR